MLSKKYFAVGTRIKFVGNKVVLCCTTKTRNLASLLKIIKQRTCLWFDDSHPDKHYRLNNTRIHCPFLNTFVQTTHASLVRNLWLKIVLCKESLSDRLGGLRGNIEHPTRKGVVEIRDYYNLDALCVFDVSMSFHEVLMSSLMGLMGTSGFSWVTPGALEENTRGPSGGSRAFKEDLVYSGGYVCLKGPVCGGEFEDCPEFQSTSAKS